MYSQPRQVLMVNRRMVSVALTAARRNTLAFRTQHDRRVFCTAVQPARCWLDIAILGESFWSLHQADVPLSAFPL